ncbi:phiSA1p31-related protein [Streptomyces poriferorum]|uniref:PhiSA1p31-related protein n=1 Tax=Streptomyces poriferorum TaxID=2798799 RepID=A0ABY9IY37_9ACTN|nr:MULTISPECIES: phiSA1p31-related protein [unclassified Streptomyces]MDP5310463.1 phiSA1p31-related protein [Streptomyces sp. Alt4]WLQ60383.1 phiSA1p31-related protein [Streptomyces sp. Alt2]
MTINHRAEAERHLSQGAFTASPEKAHPIDPVATDFHFRMAQVHATLARDEENAATLADLRDANTKLRGDLASIRRIVVDHVADNLGRQDLFSWRSARDLTKALDAYGQNIDQAVDERLEERHIDPRTAWIGPHDQVHPVTKKWTDLGGTIWDLNRPWIDCDGNSWEWTGEFDQGPLMHCKATDRTSTLDAIYIFHRPLVPGDSPETVDHPF